MAALCIEKLRSQQNVPDMAVIALTTKNWREFKVSCLHSFRRIYGQNNIPLTYVVRENNDARYDQDTFNSRIDKLVACTLHHGDAYENDNSTVYSLLVQYVGNAGLHKMVENHGMV